MQAIPGIKIIMQRTGNRKKRELLFKFVIDTKPTGPDFLTSPLIRDLILQHGLKKGSEFGWLKWNIEGKAITEEAYFPIYRLPDLFLKKGIAQALELKSLQKVRRTFPSVERFFHDRGDTRPLRKAQIEKRGLDWYEGYAIKQAIKAIKTKMAIDARKAREGRAKTQTKIRKVRIV